ncbi:MAG: hypothetical protein EOS70_11735 [Mesorhizobium sp.]|uniref:lipopolysaccharide biosynthesis protein n=1 Tax=Mesorhizobium sp. TaxID=1871066 RepID=UPI000FE52FA3|nr:oligosaccharide flippase family protein [Mesorhizobium sp.]RWC35147.1 MAG: hypothetical protein EOS70_11735 [Mesorhizobium sp.]
MAATVAVLLMNIVSGIIVARELGPYARGIFAIVTFWASFTAAVAQMSLSDAIVILWYRLSRRVDPLLASAFDVVRVAVPLAIIGGIPVLWIQLERASETRDTLLIVSSLALLVCSIWTGIVGEVYRGQLRAENRFGALQIFTILQPLIYVVGCLIVAASDAGIVGLLVAYVISLLGVFLVRWWYCGTPAARPTRRLKRAIVGTAFRLHAGTLVQVVAGQLDRMLVVSLFGPTDIGLFYVAASLASILQAAPAAAIKSIALPAMLRSEIASRGGRSIARASQMMILVSVSFGTMLALLSPVVIPLFFGSMFVSAGPLGSGVAIATIPVATRSFIVEFLKSRGHTTAVLYGNLVQVGVLITVSVLAAPMLGIWGVVLAAGLAQTAGLFHACHQACRVDPNIGWLEWIVPQWSTMIDLAGEVGRMLRRTRL